MSVIVVVITHNHDEWGWESVQAAQRPGADRPCHRLDVERVSVIEWQHAVGRSEWDKCDNGWVKFHFCYHKADTISHWNEAKTKAVPVHLTNVCWLIVYTSYTPLFACMYKMNTSRYSTHLSTLRKKIRGVGQSAVMQRKLLELISQTIFIS